MLNDPDVKRGGQDPCDRALTRELYRKKEVSKKDFQRAMNWTENEFRTHMLTAVGVLRTKTGRTRASFCRGEATPLYRIRDGESIVYCTAEEANVEFWQLDPQDMRETGHIRGAGVNKLQMADEDFRYRPSSCHPLNVYDVHLLTAIQPECRSSDYGRLRSTRG